jgi:hypothetical protein
MDNIVNSGDGAQGMIHRVYGYVAEKTFYAMLNQAKAQHIYTDEAGRVDIGALVTELVSTFAEGRYRIVSKVSEKTLAPPVGEKPKRIARKIPVVVEPEPTNDEVGETAN